MILALQTSKSYPGAWEHGYIAAALVQGGGFALNFFSVHPVPTSVEAPAVPLLLSLCLRVTGVKTPRANLLMDLLFMALAGEVVWAIWRIGASLWSNPVGLVAAWGFAVQMCAKRAYELVWFDDTNPRSLTLAYLLPSS